ncbi:unnamed protein product [Mytilus edulis]|uniref:Reverse transcriptase RNase H-like domain-containing protein n=1 Tax=Mytilus edulis TaxID=6550 RepID=A0A8S3V4X8_MYTED|nr:unnamed protein product [Mytilus edulis]
MCNKRWSRDISNQKIDVPQDYLEVVRSLVNANEDIFADSDKDLGDSLTVVPLLAYPNPNLPYVLYTDASDTCVGACLTQITEEQNAVEKPIYFLSHKLSETQTRWSTVEKEAFAIHYALQKLDFYLHGANFIIKTDHKPLKYLLDSPMKNKKLQMWSLGISGYNCKIEYIAGETNYCADLLSRTPQSDDDKGISNETVDPDINDNTYEINTINSNKLNTRNFATCTVEQPDLPSKETFQNEDLDMKLEQAKNLNIFKVKMDIETDTEDKLRIYLENIWEDSARAFAIYKEYTRRQRTKSKETDKYLNVMSSETQKQWALVLVDDDGTTRTMQSRNSVAGEMISDEKDQVKYEVLYVAETEYKLNVYLENIWEDSPRAFAIYKEYARKARIKPKQNKGSQKELLSVVNEAHTTTDQVKSKPNLPTTTEQIECKTNNHSTTEQVDNKSKTNTTTEQVESNKLKPERQSKLGYLKAFGGHLQRQKVFMGLSLQLCFCFWDVT